MKRTYARPSIEIIETVVGQALLDNSIVKSTEEDPWAETRQKDLQDWSSDIDGHASYWED